MKTKLLVGAVGLVIALVLIMQVPVMAAPGKPAKPTAFTSTGFVYVSAAGVTTVVKQAGPNVFEETAGEVVSGAISNSGWPELTGASFIMNDVSDNAKLNLKNGTMKGEATGTITVTGYDGTSTMAGTYQADISGEFYLDNNGQPCSITYPIPLSGSLTEQQVFSPTTQLRGKPRSRLHLIPGLWPAQYS